MSAGAKPEGANAVAKLGVAEVQAIFDRSPFIGFLGLKVLGLDHGTSTFSARMPLRPELERRAGTQQFHGGPIASFIDTVGDFAIGMLVGKAISLAGSIIGGTEQIKEMVSQSSRAESC